LSRTGRASAARCTEYRLDVGGTQARKLTESPTPDWEGLERSPEFHAHPAIVSIRVGFLGCVLGTLLSRERGAERSFHELRVRSETGMGTETAAAGPA